MRQLDQIVVAAYQGTKCHCGRPKHERQPFCFTCWNALEDYPGRLKLPHQLGREYTENYLAAIEYLKAKAVKK